MDFDCDGVDNSELEKRKSIFVGAQENAVKNGLHLVRNLQCDNPPALHVNKVDYEFRILDAISRLFHIDSQLACVSVAVRGEDLIVVYNSTTKLNNIKAVQLQKKIKDLFEILQNTDHFARYYNLVACCVKNKHEFYLSGKEGLADSLENVLKLLPLGVAEETGKFYALLAQEYCSFGQFGRAFREIESSCNNICRKISELNVDFVSDSSDYDDSSSDDSDLNLNKALDNIKEDKSRILKAMERLEQDCYKISQYFSEYIRVKNVNFIINAGNIHSELCLLQAFKGKNSYIGCSKLSCFFCDTILSQDETEDYKVHLGGHGIAYPMDNNDLPEILFTGRYQGAINNILSEVARCYAADISASSEPDASLQYAPTSPFVEILGVDATADL